MAGFKIICNDCGNEMTLDKDYVGHDELEELEKQKKIRFEYDEMDCVIRCLKCWNGTQM